MALVGLPLSLSASWQRQTQSGGGRKDSPDSRSGAAAYWRDQRDLLPRSRCRRRQQKGLNGGTEIEKGRERDRVDKVKYPAKIRPPLLLEERRANKEAGGKRSSGLSGPPK